MVATALFLPVLVALMLFGLDTLENILFPRPTDALTEDKPAEDE